MNKESKKLSWAIGLVAGLGVLSIAYAALSSTLYIQGNGQVSAASTVKFTACAPDSIGTSDIGYNESAGISGGHTTGMGGPYAPTAAEAAAYGEPAATPFIDSSTTASTLAGTSTSGIEIFRSTKKANHDGDSLLIQGTKLYDYGAYVIYDATVTNSGANAMKMVEAPRVKAYFTPENGTEQATPDANVKVTVHDTAAHAQAGTNEIAAWTNETSPAVNYLAAGASTHWFIKVARLGTEANTGDAKLMNGTFRFTVDLTDNASGSGAGPAFWVNADISAP